MNHPRIPALCATLLMGASLSVLPACVYTDAAYVADSGTPSYRKAKPRNPGSIIISEHSTIGHRYEVIGTIEAYGRSVNLLSSDPTREDVNEALRMEAAGRGADAVINVTYHTERTGLASRGKMKAHGQAVIFTD